MGIGVSVFLIAVGAILAFAVHLQAGWLDFNVVGWVLMVVGLLGLAATLFIFGPRSRRRSVVTRGRDSLGNEGVRRTDEYDDEGPGLV